MQKTRKTSFLKSLFGAKRQQVEPKKTLQPIDERQMRRVSGGTANLPRETW